MAPKGRTMEQFLAESRNHGWPSYRGKCMCNVLLLLLLCVCVCVCVCFYELFLIMHALWDEPIWTARLQCFTTAGGSHITFFCIFI